MTSVREQIEHAAAEFDKAIAAAEIETRAFYRRRGATDAEIEAEVKRWHEKWSEWKHHALHRILDRIEGHLDRVEQSRRVH